MDKIDGYYHMPIDLVNNLWVLIAALLVFTMTVSVGLLEVGEIGELFSVSLLKTLLITGIALFVMAFVGFNTAFAPTIDGIIGNPFYSSGFLLGGFSPNAIGMLTGVWWSMAPKYFGTGLTTSTYFLFETAFASVTLALVGVVALRKIKIEAFAIFAIVYFILIWNLPAAWIWNPTGWLFLAGFRDFAGGLVVHAAAGAAGLAILVEIWREERKQRSGLQASPSVSLNVSPTWLTLAILLLWMGWFGFNPGSVLAFNSSAMEVVVTTFLAATSSFLSLMLVRYLKSRHDPGLIYSTNGILMGLIIITPVAGFVSPGSAVILGLLGGPIFLVAEEYFANRKWFSDPIGLMPGHLVGGLFGVGMIAFFTQNAFAAASGNSNLPDGILFGGGLDALRQLGIELSGTIIVCAAVFTLSYITIRVISSAMRGILTEEAKKQAMESRLEAPFPPIES